MLSVIHTGTDMQMVIFERAVDDATSGVAGGT